jgi:hypothetical protein
VIQARSGLIERQAAADQVRVRIVVAGDHRAAPCVYLRRLGASQPPDLAVRPDADDRVAAHRHRFGELILIAGVDFAVHHNQIDGAVVFALRADDQSGNHRHTNNERYGIRREAGSHLFGF